jgi:dipeptidyl aminopeptidase/acylaminoacyl peptidase
VILRVPGGIKLQDVSRQGKVLLTRGASRVGTLGMLTGDTRERDLSWLDYSFVAGISADGQTLLFDEEGEGGGTNYTVYIRKADRSPVVRLGEGAALALSPDTRWALAGLSSPSAHFMLLPSGAGDPRRLDTGTIEPGQAAAWMPDGKAIVFAGSEPKHGARLYVVGVEGGSPRAVTPEGILAAFPGFAISPDGLRIAAVGPDRKGAVFAIGGGEPRSIPAISEGEYPLTFSADAKSLLVWKRDVPARVERVELETGRHERWKDLMPLDPSGVERISNVVVTPDGKSYAYTYSRMLSDLFVVEGLR